MRIATVSIVTLLVGLGAGLGAGRTLFQRTTTNTLVVTSAPPVSAGAPTLHITFRDAFATTGSCETDEYLPTASSVQVRAPSNGLTDGDLLGLPDESTAVFSSMEGTGCQMSVDVPDLVAASFYTINMTIQGSRNVQSTFGGAQLKRQGWSALVNMRTSADG